MAIVYLDDSNPVNTTDTTATPDAVAATLNEGDHAFILVNYKRVGSATLATPSGWTKVVDVATGSSATGVDQGEVQHVVFYKQAGASGSLGTLPTLTLGGTTTGAVIHAGMIVFRGDHGTESVVQLAYTSGSDTSADTSWSVTGGSNIGIVTDDRVFVFGAITSDTPNFSGTPTIACTGVTFGSTNTPFSTNTSAGDDLRSLCYRTIATAGTSSAAPTFTGTLTTGTNGTGGVAFIRLRENVITTKTGGAACGSAMSGAKTVTPATTFTKTGGGASAGAASGPDTVTPAATVTKAGGHVSTGAASGARQVEMPATGGAVTGGAVSGAKARDLPHAGGSASAGAVSGAKAVVHEKAGGAAAAAGALAGLRRRIIVRPGGAVATGAMSGPKTVTSAAVRTKAGGAAATGAVRGRTRAVRGATTFTKRGGGGARSAMSGPKAVTHPTTVEKTGGGAATGASSGPGRRWSHRAVGAAAAGAMSGAAEVASAAVRTKTGGTAARGALGGVRTVPTPSTTRPVRPLVAATVQPVPVRVIVS